MKIIFAICCLLSVQLYAQEIELLVRDENGPAAFHQLTLTQGGNYLGQGQTNAQGRAYISARNLQGPAIDVQGFFQEAGQKKEWSVKGKITLNSSNYAFIDLGEMTQELRSKQQDFQNQADARLKKAEQEIEKRRQEMEAKTRNFGSNDRNPNPNNNNHSRDKWGEEPENNQGRRGQCFNPIDQNQFNRLKTDLESSNFTQHRVEKLQAAFGQNCYSSRQIQDLLNLIQFETQRRDLAIQAYEVCSDPDNFSLVLNGFRSQILKREVEKATTQR